MLGLLKSRPTTINLARTSREAIEAASAQQILDAFGNVKDNIPSRVMSRVTQRLLTIVFEDERATERDREIASRLVCEVIKTTEAAFQQHPEGLKAYQQAYSAQIQNRRQFGIRSLAYKIAHVPNDQVCAEFIKRENGALLADFPRKLIESARIECIKELIRDRVPAKSSFEDDVETWLFQKIKHANAVNTAGWLLLTGDPTAMYLFTSEESKVIARYLVDYEKARLLLVELGVISISLPLSFTPLPDPSMLSQFMLQSSVERNAAEAEPSRGDTRETLLCLDREARDGFRGILISYRLFVWQKLIGGTYGERFLNELNALHAQTEAAKIIAPLTAHFGQLYDLATDASNKASFDNAVLAVVMYDHLDQTLPGRKLDEMVQACSKVLRDEMFYFPPYARYLLRHLIHGEEKAVEALIEDPLI